METMKDNVIIEPTEMENEVVEEVLGETDENPEINASDNNDRCERCDLRHKHRSGRSKRAGMYKDGEMDVNLVVQLEGLDFKAEYEGSCRGGMRGRRNKGGHHHHHRHHEMSPGSSTDQPNAHVNVNKNDDHHHDHRSKRCEQELVKDKKHHHHRHHRHERSPDKKKHHHHHHHRHGHSPDKKHYNGSVYDGHSHGSRRGRSHCRTFQNSEENQRDNYKETIVL
ncbi:hypothetical protein HDV02_004692 [Globomyces sp. JEL0801]|nr:hypothetical protein HDV02_004692 [Globomyces sp. JEL0801]